MTASPRLSVIVPVLNESAQIEAVLGRISQARHEGLIEVIVADGGSADDTVAKAAPLADRVLHAQRGRAKQMNAGAAAASGEVLLFLHADSLLPDGAFAAVLDGLRVSGCAWGRFDVRITGRPAMLRLVAAMMNVRSRVIGIATGDQAMFVRRAAFDAAGGFPDQPLMEDIELSRRLKRRSRPLCLRGPVVTSGRRWEARGVWRTIFLMWWLRLLYWLGVAPEKLAGMYR